MTEHQQLDTSLTSMDWLSRLQVNKVDGGGMPGPILDNFAKFNSPQSNLSSSTNNDIPSSPYNYNISNQNMLNKPQESLNQVNHQTDNKRLSSHTGGDSMPLLKTIPINSINSQKNNNNMNNMNNMKNLANQSNPIIQMPGVHSVAQRAEPNRPVDLSAEYKGTDYNRREGKPPYSYVNLITFAINSTVKKQMTLNEIYRWISENFHYYRYAGNGWKVRKL